MSRAAFVVLAAFLLSGCGSSEVPPGTETTTQTVMTGTDTTTTGTTTTEPPLPNLPLRRVELVGCTHYGILFPYRTDAASGLPSGYAPDSPSPVSNAGLDIVHCDQAVLDNSTVVQGFSMSTVSFPATVPSNVSGELPNNWAAEILVSEPRVRQAFSARHLPASSGSVSLSISGAVITAKVEIDNQTAYTATLAAHEDPTPPTVSGGLRMHGAQGGVPGWLDYVSRAETTSTLKQGSLEFSGFAVGALALGIEGQTAVVSSERAADYTFVFG